MYSNNQIKELKDPKFKKAWIIALMIVKYFDGNTDTFIRKPKFMRKETIVDWKKIDSEKLESSEEGFKKIKNPITFTFLLDKLVTQLNLKSSACKFLSNLLF